MVETERAENRVPEQDQGDKENEIQNLDPDCQELLKRAEPILMEERDPACEGKAEDHDN